MTEQELYDGIARKDDRAFQYLYQQHRDPIFRLVQRNSGTPEDALDLFQEGIVVLWTNISQGRFELRDEAKIATYLYTLCRNKWMSKLRKKKIILPLDTQPQVEIADDAEELQAHHDRIRRIERQLEQLGESCQKLLTLFYYQKASLREIAERMGLTEKTAKNTKYRCMLQLRTLATAKPSSS